MKVCIFLCCCSIVYPSFIYGQPGILDASFGGDGIVTTSVTTGDDFGNALVIQQDGKILLGGSIFDGSEYNLGMVRYNPDGTLDSSFDNGGTVIYEGFDLSSMIVLADGKILVSGSGSNGTNLDFAIARFTTSGILDSTFGIGGKIMVDMADEGDDYATCMALQSDNRILISGWSGDYYSNDMIVARFFENGLIDSSFGENGRLIKDIGLTGGVNWIWSIITLPDDKIVLGGSSGVYPSVDFTVVQLNEDGMPDSSFNDDGITTFGIANYNEGHSLAIQSGGKILLGGLSTSGLVWEASLIRFTSDGTLDESFGQNGSAFIYGDVSHDYGGNSIVLQPDGKILMAGHVDGATNGFLLARFDSTGNIDSLFGNEGKITTVIGSSSIGESVAIQVDNKIIVGGFSNNGADYDFAIARYLSGLEVGINNPTFKFNNVFIFPNPIFANTTLKYSLPHDEIISLRLYDMMGNSLETFLNGEVRIKGDHTESISLDKSISPGNYLLLMTTGSQILTIKVTKQ